MLEMQEGEALRPVLQIQEENEAHKSEVAAWIKVPNEYIEAH